MNSAPKINLHKKLHENLLFASGGGDFHDYFCGGQAELQKTGKNCPMNDKKECDCGKDCGCGK